jgi:hypothetical protein
MRKTLLFGSLLAVSLMMMLPAVAAEEAKIAQSTLTSQNLLDMETTYLKEIQDRYKNNPAPQCIIITLAIMFLKLLRWGVLIIFGIILLGILRIIRGQNNTTGVFC